MDAIIECNVLRELFTIANCNTPCSKKVSHLMFDNNFGKCGPSFTILSKEVCTTPREKERNIEFSCESPGERILNIDPHSQKLLSIIKWLTFFGTRCIATVSLAVSTQYTK